jgi:hypothetical protein
VFMNTRATPNGRAAVNTGFRANVAGCRPQSQSVCRLPREPAGTTSPVVLMQLQPQLSRVRRIALSDKEDPGPKDHGN